MSIKQLQAQGSKRPAQTIANSGQETMSSTIRELTAEEIIRDRDAEIERLRTVIAQQHQRKGYQEMCRESWEMAARAGQVSANDPRLQPGHVFGGTLAERRADDNWQWRQAAALKAMGGEV